MTKLVLVALVLAGCTKTDSDDVLTSGIHAQITAETLGDGTTAVSATLFLGNPINFNYVELTGDDQLIASHAGEDKVMLESELLNAVSHYAVFPVDAAGATFDVAFVRTVDDGAPRSVATLPASFMLVSSPASASRAEALTVTWSPIETDDLMSWVATGDCIERATGAIEGDPGSVTIPANTIVPRATQGTPTSCPIAISISRTRLGALDPGYGEGGSIRGVQTRQATVTSMP